MIENQLDLSMKKVFLGFSKTETLYASGCLVHCIARILNLPRLEVHDQLKAKGCFFNVCLLDLTKVPLAFPQLTYTGKFTYDNNIALEAIKRNGIVIAEVDYNPIMNGTQQHFVCMVGNGQIEDPLGGKLKLVSTYKTYLTLRVFEIKPVLQVDPLENTMTANEKAILDFVKEKGITETQVRQGYGYVIDKVSETLAKQSKEIDDLKVLSQDLAERVSLLEADSKAQLKDINNKNKTINDLQSIKKIDDYSIEEVLRLLFNKILKK